MAEIKIKYTNIQHEVKKYLEITSTEYLLLHAIYFISTYPTNSGWCENSQQELGDHVDLTRESVNRMITRLEEKGFIVRSKKGLKTTSKWYDIAYLDNFTIPSDTKSQESSKECDETSHGAVTKHHTNCDETSHSYIYTKNIKNNIKKTKKTLVEVEQEFEEFLSEESIKETWGKWKQYRRERGLKLGYTSAKNQLQMLLDNRNQAIQIIEQSITNTWQGLFPVKNTYQNKNSTPIETSIYDNIGVTIEY